MPQADGMVHRGPVRREPQQAAPLGPRHWLSPAQPQEKRSSGVSGMSKGRFCSGCGGTSIGKA